MEIDSTAIIGLAMRLLARLEVRQEPTAASPLAANTAAAGPWISSSRKMKISPAAKEFLVKGAALVVPGRWVCIEQHVRLNTPGKEDGVLRAWVDGQPVFARRKLRLRDTLEVGIENAWFDLYMGGQQAALRDMSINIAQVVVASRYIGTLAP